MTEPRRARHGDDALFRGAARLGVLAGGLGLRWQALAPLVAAFPAELRDELELGVATGDIPLWIRTRGDGKPMTFRTARFLEERGVAEATLRRLLVTAEHQGHHHLLLDLGLDATGLSAWRWLLRRPMDLPTTDAWLAAAGADLDTRARLKLIAEALERDHSHAVGERVQVDGSVYQQVVFSLPATGSSWPLLLLAVQRAGLPTDALDRLAPALAERDCRLQLTRMPGAAGLRAVLDFDGLPQDRLDVLLDAVTAPDAARDRLDVLTPFASDGRLDTVSLHLDGTGPRSVAAWLETTRPLD